MREVSFSFEAGSPVWVHFDSWAARTKKAATLLKINPKRSRVQIKGETITILVPNYAITKRNTEDDQAPVVIQFKELIR